MNLSADDDEKNEEEIEHFSNYFMQGNSCNIRTAECMGVLSESGVVGYRHPCCFQCDLAVHGQIPKDQICICFRIKSDSGLNLIQKSESL